MDQRRIGFRVEPDDDLLAGGDERPRGVAGGVVLGPGGDEALVRGGEDDDASGALGAARARVASLPTVRSRRIGAASLEESGALACTAASTSSRCARVFAPFV
jgi:hypothetical protein